MVVVFSAGGKHAGSGKPIKKKSVVMHSGHECPWLRSHFYQLVVHFRITLISFGLKKNQHGQLMFTLWTVGQIVHGSDVPTRALAVITCRGGPKVPL